MSVASCAVATVVIRQSAALVVMPFFLRRAARSQAYYLRLHSQHHPDAAESENQIREPCGNEWREPVDPSQFVE